LVVRDVVEHAGSPTHTVYADMTLTRSKVKVTDHLNLRQLPISQHSNGHIFRYCVKIHSYGWVCW